MEGLRTIRCSDGQWNGKKPSCKAPCIKLAPPAHGRRIGEGFRHGASVRFNCRHGYTLVGASPITCNDGTWNNPAPVCKGICPRPNAPYKGRLLVYKDRYLDGDEVIYSCDSNHDLFGKDRIRCVGKSWDSSEPVCKARCRFSRRPGGGLYVDGRVKKSDMIKHGESITYGCLTDYTMFGSKTKRCDNGRWTSDAPVCKAPCQSPDDIAHGKKIGLDYKHGKEVSYQCDADYTLEGNDRLTCRDGRWDLKPPECKAPCRKPRTPLNGSMLGDHFTHRSRVTFTCDQNYQLDGNSNIQCNNGFWSGLVPNCVAVCRDPGIPSKGKRLDNNFQEGRTVTFKCNRDHELVGNDKIQCEGGIWTGEVPKCRARCAFDGNPDNGYTTNGNFQINQPLSHGSNVEYACKVSYTLVGSIVRRCEDGSWDTSPPSCKASCDNPGLVEKGRKIGQEYSHGQIVKYECTSPGYSLVGTPELTCNDGSWDSKRPECKKSCNPLPELSNGKVNSNNTNHGALVSFSCSKGFQLKGPKQILCINGKWNASSPLCKGLCKDPGSFDNGKVTGNDYSYDSSVRFQCNSDYDLLGATVLTCKKGRWTSTIPVCKKRCPHPGNPQNGWKIGMNHSHGGSVRFVCKDGPFDLVGASRIACNEGEWSNETPSCEARCSDPGIPGNGTKDGDDYRSRANVTFGCSPPLELTGSHVIFCQDGKWSASTPTCSNCARPLGLQDNKNRIRSPASLTNPNYPPDAARLNGLSAWCPSRTPAYLQIDLDKTYKLTAIATQGGTVRNKWVHRYTISFNAGENFIDYTESGSTKVILGNKDASSLVEYKLKEPFISRTVRIHPSSPPNDPICLRMELYGCYPNPDCILVGSVFWGLWSQNHGADNYYKARITKLTATRLNFVLTIGRQYKKSYPRTETVLILNTIPKLKDFVINSSVIAKSDIAERYRSGTVLGFPNPTSVSVKFDDGKTKVVLLEDLRLVKRPRFCVNDV